MSSSTLLTANKTKWHDMYPELGTGPISIEPYVSREYFEKERARIFCKVWLHVGRAEQVSNPGDYFVKDLAVCNTSILVVRGQDGMLRAFHNMCSHRGNQLVVLESGKCKGLFTCKFHGWAYDWDGSLRHVSSEANFFNLDKASLALTPLSVDTWEGFVFINLDPDPPETLDEYLGEFGSSFGGYPFAELASTQFFWRTEIKANWKIVKDAFQEVWHIPFLHHKTVFYKPSNPYGSAMGFKLYGRHGKIYPPRKKAPANGEQKRPQTRVESLAVRYGAGPIHRDQSGSLAGNGSSPKRDPEFVLGGSSIFPNLMLYIGEQTYLTHTFWPLAENRTLWEVKYYYPKARTLAERFAQEYHKVILRDINMEDGSTLERTQAMLASGAKREIVLQDQELLIRHHHKVAESYLND